MAPSARLLFFVVALSSLSIAGCADPADVGEMCTDTADCMPGLSCIGETSAADAPRACMTDCDLTMTRLCDDGAVCTPVLSAVRSPDLGVCFLGGSTEVGSPCLENLECVRGAICVSPADASASTCYRACTTTVSGECDAGETCAPLEDMGDKGYCQPAP